MIEFKDTHDKADYFIWLRLRDLGPEDDNERLRLAWSKSKRRGNHQQILDRRRRKMFGPGKYYAATSAGVFLNKNFVKGWRGINPKNP